LYLACYDLRVDEISDSINNKTSISLSRNKPVALVVGAAGFLGSHLVDQLLDKGIQVIGVDDLSNGKKQNLQDAAGDKNLHFLIESPDGLELELSRLDYLFILPSENWNLQKILDLFSKTKCRCLLFSSIELYENGADLRWLKEAEKKLARCADRNHLNARVLRLGPVYGPRMDFKVDDPMIRLIAQALKGDLQKDVSLEFSSRALYVSDAVDLGIRTIFAGSTAQKIFDGVLPDPLKVAEIKQVLLDPVWYEQKDFIPSELPPWPTPNLEKTIRTLSWHPNIKLVACLRKTLEYLKENEVEIPEPEDGPVAGGSKTDEKESAKWDEARKESLEAFKRSGADRDRVETKKGRWRLKFPVSFSRTYMLFLLALVTYALIWPALLFGWGIFTFDIKFNQGLKNLQKGEFEQSLADFKRANDGLTEVQSIYNNLEPVRRINIFRKQFETIDRLLNLSSLSVSASRNTILGIQALIKSIKAVTGEIADSPAEYLSNAQVELNSAQEDLSKAEAILKNSNLERGLPGILAEKVNKISGQVSDSRKLVSKAYSASILFPKLVAVDGVRNYLVLLQNNTELRPTGGFIGSFAKVTFEEGKLKKLNVNDIYTIDGQLAVHVEPPKEIKEDLGQKDFFLRDSNWEPDFPAAAKQAQWFYTKETGERIEGVVALDVSALEHLLANTGPVDLPDYQEKITAENIFEKTVAHADLSFSPGSQAKKSFLTTLTSGAMERIFFLPQNNWPEILTALGKLLDEKHISVYLNDPKLFSFIVSQNWMHTMPVQTEQNKNRDFLSVVEANLGANKANYYLDRSYNLETVAGKSGEIKHRLRISYLNRSPSETFPGGKYKNRIRLYLPFGTQLTRALWGETDITKAVSSFTDYGRTGYSVLLELLPKEQKTLVVDYAVPLKLEFQNGVALYRLDIIKQAGTDKDPLQWTVTHPINYKVISPQVKQTGPQEQKVSTDLSVDRSFEVEFRK